MISAIRARWRRRKQLAAARAGALREFVYLDETSVYSLLASRTGPVATDFTPTEAATMTAELAGTVGTNVGVGKAETRSRLQTGQSTTSQVVRKSSAQARFKQLLDDEADRLALRSRPSASVPIVGQPADLDGLLRRASGWVIDAKSLPRASLIEIDVQLEADPVFKVAEAVAAFMSIVGEDTAAIGLGNIEGAAEMAAMGQLLNGLLAGLVPIRARAADHRIVEHGDKALLVHREVLNQLPAALPSRPAYVCGVAETALFWKDLRRAGSPATATPLCAGSPATG